MAIAIEERGPIRVYELIQRVADEYRTTDSLPELYRAAARLTKRELDADFGVVASGSGGSVHALATAPSDWTDVDGLLTPTSLPNVASCQGRSYIIDDKSHVRSAGQTSSIDHGATSRYQSLIWVPVGDGRFLLAGARETSAFFEPDLNRLRTISTITGLQEARMVEARDRRRAGDHVEEAAAFLSHDATNLLSVVLGRLELARESGDDEHLESIERNLERLTDLVNDTATLLRTGSHVTELEAVPLSRVVTDAWASVDADGATLGSVPDATVLAEESRLCQLLENLFRNAVDHAGPTVTVRVGLLEDGRGFYVADDGPGIDPDEREQIFDLGYTTADDNSGVGLSIVRRIAEAHGWVVSVTASADGGTRFEFRGVEVSEG